MRILRRRAEMLDAVSTGLHPSAVITQLAGSMVLRSGLCEVIGRDGGSGSNMVAYVDRNSQKAEKEGGAGEN